MKTLTPGHHKGCRCQGCVTQRRRYGKHHRLDRLRNGPRMVDAAPTSARLRQLLDAGWATLHLEHLTGMDNATILRVAAAEQRKIHRGFAARVAACQPHANNAPTPKTTVPAIGAIRRVEALQRLGHSGRVIEAGTTLTDVSRWLVSARRRGQCEARTWLSIAALYERLCMTLGDSKVTATRAERRRMAPPLAWDDDTIDDPAAKPARTTPAEAARKVFDEVAVRRAVNGDRVRLTSAERSEAVRILRERGLSYNAVADRLGLADRSVAHIIAVARARQSEPEQVAS